VKISEIDEDVQEKSANMKEFNPRSKRGVKKGVEPVFAKLFDS
jgi:hypothetical protein